MVLVTAAAGGLLLLAAAPAAAHVEASAEGAQAGTGPVVVTFSAEAESSTAGIVGVKTQLPEGIAPADVTLASGPAGWALTPTADGFEIAGPDIGPGVDAVYAVTIAQLPANRTELAFPTLQRYSDGREDAWIEPVTDAVPNPDRPAPVLTVAPAPPGATTAPSSSAAPTSSATTPTSADPAESADPETASQSSEDESNTGTILLVVAAVAILAIGAAGWFWRSRRTR
jgi:hypothetical protein